MSTESDELYDIAFAGECLDGHDPAAVRAAMQQLFKADAATLERLFSGKRQRIKRHCDKATALKYQTSLTRAGAKAIITRASPEVTAVNRASPEVTTPQQSDRDTGRGSERGSETAAVGAVTTTDSASDSLQLLPGGSDILRPDERRSYEVREVDLSHLSVAASGERLSDENSTPPPPVAAPELDLAEPGAQLGPIGEQETPEISETLTLELAPAGSDLLDAGAEVAVTPVSTDHLTLGAAGSDLLSESERPKVDGKAPDTSHLALDEPADQLAKS